MNANRFELADEIGWLAEVAAVAFLIMLGGLVAVEAVDLLGILFDALGVAALTELWNAVIELLRYAVYATAAAYAVFRGVRHANEV